MDAEEVKEKTLSSEEELGETWKPDFFFTRPGSSHPILT